MKIVVSACLMGESCKYNGLDNYHRELVEAWIEAEIASLDTGRVAQCASYGLDVLLFHLVAGAAVSPYVPYHEPHGDVVYQLCQLKAFQLAKATTLR